MVEQVVRDALDRLEADDAYDFATVAKRVPMTVLSQLMGLPAERSDEFQQMSDTALPLFGPGGPDDSSRAEATTGAITLLTYFTDLAEERRRQPGDDLFSVLVTSDIEIPLTDQELAWFGLLLLIAGTETTTSLLGNLVLQLIDHDDQWQLLRDNQGLIPNAIEESLRYESPVQGHYREAASTFELGGATIEAGSRVLILFGAANRDPAHYDDPDTFRIERDASDHIAFGNGIHLCLGAPLARMEGVVLLEQLLDRYSRLRLRGEPRRTRYPMHRGVAWMPLELARR